MKLLTFYENGGLRYGVKTEKGVLDLTASYADVPKTMDDFIDGGEPAKKKVAAYMANPGSGAVYHEEDTLKLGPCVPHPVRILGIGMNYYEYMMNQHSKKPDFPHLFPKYPDAVRGQNDPVIIPFNSEQVDFEAELCVVIGKRARLVQEEDALNYVLGYCNANDISSRDFQNATSSWMPGKCCDTFAPIGPYLVTADEIPDPNNLRVRSWVNGELRQNYNTNDMIRNVKFLISGISRFFALKPGDIIFTGTSVGVIVCEPEDKRVWLKGGDVLEMEVDGLGHLTNPVKKEIL